MRAYARPGEGGARRREVREFKTTVRSLLGLRDWLTESGVTHVAMVLVAGVGDPGECGVSEFVIERPTFSNPTLSVVSGRWPHNG